MKSIGERENACFFCLKSGKCGKRRRTKQKKGGSTLRTALAVQHHCRLTSCRSAAAAARLAWAAHPSPWQPGAGSNTRRAVRSCTCARGADVVWDAVCEAREREHSGQTANGSRGTPRRRDTRARSQRRLKQHRGCIGCFFSHGARRKKYAATLAHAHVLHCALWRDHFAPKHGGCRVGVESRRTQLAVRVVVVIIIIASDVAGALLTRMERDVILRRRGVVHANVGHGETADVCCEQRVNERMTRSMCDRRVFPASL